MVTFYKNFDEFKEDEETKHKQSLETTENAAQVTQPTPSPDYLIISIDTAFAGL